MKKLILLALFSIVSIWASAQFVTVNYSSSDLTIGVQFQNPILPCSPVSEMTMIVPAGGNYVFTIPPGTEVMRVGAWAGIDSGWEYSPCTTCGPNSPGLFTFYWDSCPTPTGVKILY